MAACIPDLDNSGVLRHADSAKLPSHRGCDDYELALSVKA